MRSSTIFACATLLFGPVAFSTPATQPSTNPSVEPATTAAIDGTHGPTNVTHQQITPKFDIQANVRDSDLDPVGKAIDKVIGRNNPPTSQPVPVDAGSVLILPLSESAGASYPWISRAIQQDMLAELSPTTRAHIDAPASMLPAVDAAMALQAGRRVNATLVIYGQYQVIGNQARITGQLLDVKSEKPGGSFFATGSMNNLFPLEDSINSQILRALPTGWLTVALPPVNQTGEGTAEPYTAPPAAQPQIAVQPPQYYSYTYPDYVAPGPGYWYDYGAYPYYGYSVPYYGPDIWFFGDVDFFHHHYWDHGWRGWHGREFGHGISHGFSHAPAAHSSGGGGFHGGGGGGGFHGRR